MNVNAQVKKKKKNQNIGVLRIAARLLVDFKTKPIDEKTLLQMFRFVFVCNNVFE